MTATILLITGPAKDIGAVPLIKAALVKAGYTVEVLLDGPYMTERACKIGMSSIVRKRLEPFIVAPQNVTILDVSKDSVPLSDMQKNLVVVCDRMSVENDFHLPHDCPTYYLPELDIDVETMRKAITYCEKGPAT